MMNQDSGERGDGGRSFKDTNPEAWEAMREMARKATELWIKRRNGRWLKGLICSMEPDGITVIYHDAQDKEKDLIKKVDSAELWQWQSEAPKSEVEKE